MTLIEYSLFLFFVFLVYNYTDIAKPIKSRIEPYLSDNGKYILQCSICFPFWISVAVVLFSPFTWTSIFITPLIVHFLHLIYDRLVK